MRTALLSLVLFAIVIAGMHGKESRAQTPPADPKNLEAEKLGKALVAAISTDNYGAYTDLLVTQHEYVVVMQSSLDADIQDMANDSIEGMKNVHRTAMRSFTSIQSNGKREGIAWEKTQYTSSTHSMDTISGVEIIQLVIAMEFRGVEYVITADDVVKTASGWKIMGYVAFGKRKKDVRNSMLYSQSKREAMMEVEISRLIDSIVKADSLAELEMQKRDSAAKAQAEKSKGKKKQKKKE